MIVKDWLDISSNKASKRALRKEVAYMHEMSQSDFAKLMEFLRSNFGIDLSKKKQLVEGRLFKPFCDSGFESFSDYIDSMLHGGEENIGQLLNRLTTNHSYFMRERSHFDFFRDTILPELERRKKNKVLGIWSAGCSTGQEPYTLSMILKDYFSAKPGWDTRVLATDISQRAMGIARRGVYDTESVGSVPEQWKHRYMAESNGYYTISPVIRDNVIFRTFNLMDPINFKIKFDVIFCRNVMIYFDQPTKEALVRRFYGATNGGGYLLVGHAETLVKSSNPYKYVDVAAYVKR